MRGEERITSKKWNNTRNTSAYKITEERRGEERRGEVTAHDSTVLILSKKLKH